MTSLLKYNTFGIDQACENIFEPTTEEELKALLPLLTNKPLLVIGGGSNLLLTQDFKGNVVHPRMKGIEVVDDNDDNVLIRCGAGEVWDDVVAYSIDNSWYGMENLSLIPGEVGASAVQNIGAYGMEAKDIIYKVEAIEIKTGAKTTFNASDLKYAYRYSRFKSDLKGQYIITYVTYKLNKVFVPSLDYGNLRAVLEKQGISSPTASDVRQAVIDVRESKLPDPKIEGNAGSFFMNPVVDRGKLEELQQQYPDMPFYNIDDAHVKIPAGWMIEQCGWKGKSVGKAGVHAKQALVLVNKGGAKGEDIVNLCNMIRSDVKERFGIEINPEVNII